MRSEHWRQYGLLAGALAVLGAMIVAALFFASATPVGSQVFATNTPPPPDPLEIAPAGPAGQYALRFWTEADMIDLLTSQIQRLRQGDAEQVGAIAFTQFELERRFPGAPTDPNKRAQLLGAALTAPRGAVDMRPVVRPTIMDALNSRLDEIDSERENSLVIDNFLVQTSPIRLDDDEFADAMVFIRYPATAAGPSAAVYEDYALAFGRADGSFSIGVDTIPAAPYGDIETVTLLRLGDVNLDGLDELALGVDRGDINREMLIFGGRDESIVSLIQPGQRLDYGELVSWPESSSTLTVAHYQSESTRWLCESARPVDWEWSSSFYRPNIVESRAYRPLDSVGCLLSREEPVFAQAPGDAIVALSGILSAAEPGARGYARGQMAIAMLHLLNGDQAAAERTIGEIFPLAETDLWLSGQIEAFATTAALGDFTPVEVCAALAAQNPDGACDVDQVLLQLFVDNPILRARDVKDQLEDLGLPVLERRVVSQIGRLDREVVNFNLTGASWWAFAPTNEEFYIPSPTEAPEGFGAAALPVGFVDAPDSAYASYFGGDASATLSLIDNAAMNGGGAPLSPEARFLQALAYDTLSNRQEARDAYYSLWVDFSDNAWGMLAGAHLEAR